MNYFLGVDAGGTKTQFAVGDATRELARVQVGSIKRMRVSAAEAESNLQQALGELTRRSGIPMTAITCCRIGAAGNTVPLVADWLRQTFPQYVGGRLSLVNDVEIALDAAFQGGRGIVVLAGTGSNVACRDRSGAILTAGGWGPALGDYGSGHYLGLLGLRRCFRAIDRQRPTALLQAALAHWGLDSVEDLIAYANEVPAPDFSRLAPGFVACAEKGDEVAVEVMMQGGRKLAESVALLIERLRGVEKDTVFRPPPVAVAGSIMTHARLVRETMNQNLLTRFPEIELLDEPTDPLLGALWGARQSEIANAKFE